MKLKGIWITICLIVVAGVCVTSYTRQYTSETAAMRTFEEALSAPEPEADEAGGLGAAAPAEAAFEEPRIAAAEGQMETGGLAADSAEADAAPAKAAETSAVMQELAELDDQIARSHSGSVDTTTNSLKASAESEWKLWDAKMEQFLDILEKRLPEEERDELFLEQKEWIRDREAAATAASKKQNGSALTELEYNLTSKDITRERVYDLAIRYEKELTEE